MVEPLKKKKQIKWTDEKKKYLLDNYEYGDLKEICKVIGCTYSSLKSMARILGIKSLKEKNKYKLKKLLDDNLYNYYWWGYILADGYINSERGYLTISIKESDKNHLLNLANYLNINLKTRFVKTKYSSGYHSFIFCQDVVYGNKLKNKLGISSKKTYNSIDFNFINNKDLFLSLFIGFYDGDGCINSYNLKNEINSIKIETHKSWQDFLFFCKDKLKEYLNINSYVKLTKKNSAILTINKKSNIELLRNYIKNNSLPIMLRKWENDSSIY